MNSVLILSYNGLPLLKKCVESVRKQDIPTDIFILDNGSSDGTDSWLDDMLGTVGSCSFNENKGVSSGWNMGLSMLLEEDLDNHCLVLNQDAVLPPYFYRDLLAYNVPFVTGFPVATMDDLEPQAPRAQSGLSPHPCFSAFLIKRECWEKIGPFREEKFDDDGKRKMVGFWSWANDCDYHARAHRLGIEMWKSEVPFYHESSSTIRNASDEDRQWLNEQANMDRAVFHSIYNCLPGQKEYEALFSPETFGIDAK